MTRKVRLIALGGAGLAVLIVAGALVIAIYFDDEWPWLVPLIQAVAQDNLQEVDSMLNESPKLVNAGFKSVINATPLHMARSMPWRIYFSGEAPTSMRLTSVERRRLIGI